MGWVERFSETLARMIETSAPLAPIAAFVGGVLTALNPCVLAMIPLMVGFAAGAAGRSGEAGSPRGIWQRTLGFSLLLVAGFALELALLFTVFTAASTWLQASWWRFVLAGICLVTGLHLLGVLRIRSLTIQPAASRAAGALGALALGFLFGIISLPCTGPVLLMLVALVPQVGAARAGGLLFLYGVGHSLLIVIAGTSVGVATALLGSRRLQETTRRVRQAAGVLILVGAAWLLLA